MLSLKIPTWKLMKVRILKFDNLFDYDEPDEVESENDEETEED